MTFTPFTNEADAISLDGLSIENHVDRIALFGNLTITRDKTGLKRALALAKVLNDAVNSLQADKTLPEAIEPDLAPTAGRDPFGT